MSEVHHRFHCLFWPMLLMSASNKGSFGVIVFFLGVQDQLNHLRGRSMHPNRLKTRPLLADGSRLADTLIHRRL